MRANDHPLYFIWTQMRYRCMRKRHPAWKHYGGRGIKVCKRWQKFDAFVEDMGPRPDGLTLDRIDNDGNYKPSNCRWASYRKQNHNSRNTRMITFDGKTCRIGEWEQRLGFRQSAITTRLKRGWSYKDALTLKPYERRVYSTTKGDMP